MVGEQSRMYIYLKVELPFCLYLEDECYEVFASDSENTEPVRVYLSKKRRDKEKNRLQNFLASRSSGTGGIVARQIWHVSQNSRIDCVSSFVNIF